MEELIDKGKAKKTKSKDMIFETTLNDTVILERQEAIKNLREDETLKIDTFLKDEVIGFEVFTLEDKSIGIVPTDTARELEDAMKKGLEPYILNHKVGKKEDMTYECKIRLGLKK